MPLEIIPCTLRDANLFTAAVHRHHGPVTGHKYSIALSDGIRIVGVVIASRPVARHDDDGLTIEITRLTSDGTPNVCSKLYRAAWRAAKELGYRRVITFTLESESGASLRAAGFRCLGFAGGGSWSRNKRPRTDKHPTGRKLKWELWCGDRDELRKQSEPVLPKASADAVQRASI